MTIERAKTKVRRRQVAAWICYVLDAGIVVASIALPFYGGRIPVWFEGGVIGGLLAGGSLFWGQASSWKEFADTLPVADGTDSDIEPEA